MQLDSRRGLNPDDVQFSLNEIQKNTIANHKVVAQLEYSLKNQNFVRVPSNTSQITTGSEIVFSFDKSYLANNSYLNRCKTKSTYKVKIPLQNLSATVTTAANYVANGTANAGTRTSVVNNHGWDPLNCGLTPFITNKALSRREIDFSGKSIQSQNFNDVNEIDELATMYDQDALEEMGIYPEKIYGFQGIVGNVYGEAPNIPFFYDGAQSALMCTANDVERLNQRAMAKRNANGKYYWTSSSQYFTSTGVPVGGFTFTRNTTGQIKIKNTINQPNIEFGVGARGHPNPRIDLTAAGVTAIGVGGYQEIEFNVEEDLISDLFTNIYAKNPRYYAMNSAELNFRFEQNANMSTLFKSSNGYQILGDPTVSLEKMTLEFITFNLGTVQIPFGIFEIPFFIQTANRHNGRLTSSVNGYVNLEVPVISYSTIPHFIKIDLFSGADRADWGVLTKLIQMSGITLKLDQDEGSVLQQMSIQDLMTRTVHNLGAQKQTWEQVYYGMPSDFKGIASPTSTSVATNYLESYPQTLGTSDVSVQPICPFLFLRVGEDIRLQAGLEAGMRERINLTWTIQADNVWLSLAAPYNVTTKITAYTCGKYVISPVNGLLDTTEISYSRNEWMANIGKASDALASLKDGDKLPMYNESYKVPQSMVLGGSWYGSLARSVRPVLSVVKNIAKKVDKIADTVGTVARTTYETLDSVGYGGKRIKYV